MHELKLEEVTLPAGKTAEQVAANYYIASLILFVACRFIFTGLMKYFKPGNLLTFASLLAIALTFIVVFMGGHEGVYALVGISGCMSLMFPTIFGLAVKGLVSTIVDRASETSTINLPAGINMAYLVPMACFIIITLYAVKVANKY